MRKALWTDEELFRRRRATPISTTSRLILGVLIFFGLQSVALFGWWWFRAAHVSNRPLFVLLSGAVWYGVFRMLVGWYNLFHIEQPPAKEAPRDLSVAIFTTSSPGEPFEMFVRTLAALGDITYPHTTYLLDDTRDPRFAELAEASGAVHLELVGLPGAKEGKINAALDRTREKLILVL